MHRCEPAVNREATLCCGPQTARTRLVGLALVVAIVVALFGATSGARAIVLNENASRYGVALVPGTPTSGLPTPPPTGSCSDPWLSSDLGGPTLPPGALCWQGGGTTPANAVMHANETFAITWDGGTRSYWATTRNYVEQFLRDVADGSGTFTSPYAVTTQYRDQSGRAANASKYGGGCIDYGNPGGSTCQFGNTFATGQGVSYSSVCQTTSNGYSCTDAQLRGELTAMVQHMGLVGRLQPGYTPLLILMTPSDVVDCIDSGGTLCSANGTSSPQFCSYHSYFTVGGTNFAYVVQPWTANTNCDEQNLPALPPGNPAIDVGRRLVSPLSAGEIAAIVNPWLNGWFAADGSEINDNPGNDPAPCGPAGAPNDAVTVGGSGQNPYYVQAEFNNAGVIEVDPNAAECALGVELSPTFVVPSPIDQGDVVAFDGSTTVSTLMIPTANYHWSFGDGTSTAGASVVHSYSCGGTYSVTLMVTDRGGNVSSVSQPVVVLGPSCRGQSPPPPGTSPSPGLVVHLKLMPQGLRDMLRAGIAVRVSSNVRADGIVTLSISRAQAKRAHIKVGPGPAVVIGRGTVSSIKPGIVTLHLRLSRATAAKLRHLRHVTVTLRLALFAAGGRHIVLDVAGHY